MRLGIAALVVLLPLAGAACMRESSSRSSSQIARVRQAYDDSHRLDKPKNNVAAGSAPFVCGKRSKVYHQRHCAYAVGLESPIGFASAAAAEEAGRIPCQFCSPREAGRSAGSPEDSLEKQQPETRLRSKEQ